MSDQPKRGRGQPRKGLLPRRGVTVRMEPATLAALDAACEARGVTRSDLVAELVAAYWPS